MSTATLQPEAVTAQARADLGIALGLRAEECARSVDARMGESRWVGLPPSHEYMERRQQHSWFATLLVARWLVAGIAADEVEMAWGSQRGRIAAQEGLSIINTARGYLVWRDMAIAIIKEEARRLDTPSAVVAAALGALRSSCDSGLMRMNAEFDRQLQTLIEERKQLEEQLRHQALHDSLTNLANRTLFGDRLIHALERRARAPAAVAVMIVDVDDFKTVNDSQGHSIGDCLLMEIAGRLRSSVRSVDTVARFGGDEFAVLLESITDSESAVEAAKRVLAAFEAAFHLAGRSLPVSVSIGLAMASGTDGADDVVRNADVAMYVAKARGRAGYVFFAPGMQLGAA
jgi:diguanylate cyclase (GGDEF)-like protein